MEQAGEPGWRQGQRHEAVAPGDRASNELAGIAADTRTASLCTLVSRATGFARVATIAAVLGPTYFANLFQTVNFLPSLLHELLSGSLITAMLVPPLVRHLDLGDAAAARRVANGFLGVALSLFLVATLLCALLAPAVIQLMTMPVGDAAVRALQQEVGRLLILVILPQLLFYGLIAVGVAVQHAHRRFALAAAAPAVENLGTIAVLLASAVVFGAGQDVGAIGEQHVLFLGIGCTLAVMLHAAVQWYGAWRLGVPLLPKPGWRCPEVRRILRLALPSSGYAGLNSTTLFGLIVVAGSIPGGAVAFMIGVNFFNLPVALCARPVASAQLPRLARSFNHGQLEAFHSTYRSSLGLTLFLTLPAGLLFVALGHSLANAVAFGHMGGAGAVALVTAAIASQGLAVLGESTFLVANSASYARRDATSPLYAMALRGAIAALGMALALQLAAGPAVLWTIGLGFSLATVLAAAFLDHRQRRVLPALSSLPLMKALGDLGIAALAILPGVIVASLLADVCVGVPLSIALAIGAIAASGLVYLGLQWLRGSPDLAMFLARVGSQPERAGNAS